MPTELTIGKASSVSEYAFRVIRDFPHDSSAFTQGLAYRNGYMYEGTGLEGQSSIRKVELETGEVLQSRDLPSQYFGEGIAFLNDELLGITWRNGVGFVYDANSLHRKSQFRYEGEGWGLTSDGHQLFLSDGTDKIRVLDPKSFAVQRRIKVHHHGIRVRRLNDLEWVEGQILANVWFSNRIARICPQTGAVVGWIDLSGILSDEYQLGSEDVLNGIAYDAKGKRLFVTGKRWPKVFQIEIVPK